MTETAKTEDKATRTKKGEGPVVMAFLDGENKEAARISDKTVALQIKDKNSGVLSFDLSKLPENVVRMLAADALKKRIDSTVRATVDGEGKDEQGNYIVLKTAEEVIARIMSGQIYARTGVTAKEGEAKGSRGRPFDFALWVDAMRDAAKIKASQGKKRENGAVWTEATEDQLSRLRVKLESATPAERKKMTDGFLKDKTVAFARSKIIAKRLAEAAQSEAPEGTKEVSVDFD